MFAASVGQTATCSISALLMHRLRPDKHRIVLRRQVFDQDFVLFWRELRTAATGAGVFAGEVVSENVSIPVREFVVGSSRRKSQDKSILLNRNFQRPEVLVRILAHICAERFGGGGSLQRRQRGIV